MADNRFDAKESGATARHALDAWAMAKEAKEAKEADNAVKVPDFVLLPTGERLRADYILAIRPADYVEVDELYGNSKPINWRVVVDFGDTGKDMFGGYSYNNSVILYCESREERDALAARIYADVQVALGRKEK